jgi:drug/metabolite transporter (DMT)-like permease
VGFGLFYSPLCAAAAFQPAWLLAASWQFTILAGALLTPLFGKPLPRRTLAVSSVVFAGICLLQAEEARTAAPSELALGLVLAAGLLGLVLVVAGIALNGRIQARG